MTSTRRAFLAALAGIPILRTIAPSLRTRGDAFVDFGRGTKVRLHGCQRVFTGGEVWLEGSRISTWREVAP